MFSFITQRTSKKARVRGTMPPLRFHNTLSGAIEHFTPLSAREVKIYNCGPTVYGTQHIGNMSAAVFADTLRRVLVAWGYCVKQVINITDFGHLTSDADEGEDKMTTGLKREGLALTLDNMRTLAEKYTQEYFDDIDLLGVEREKIIFPRASQYIAEQISLVKTLVEKEYAYATRQGVYFDVSQFSSYGKLGGINLEGQREGARVKSNSQKRGPFDFILWKSDPKLGWQSPWGMGFPGWHIECTAMIFTLLGKQIDIHTGGIEHIPVHHNNEIAQAEAVTGKQFVRYWMHNNHITIEGKKISKSLGNTVYLRNLIDRGLAPKALRYWFLTAHYRSPANFTWDAIEGANTALGRLNRLYAVDLADISEGEVDPSFEKDFLEALANDLDTPRALARVWELTKDISVSHADKKASLGMADTILGLGLQEERPQVRLSVMPHTELPEEVQKLLAERAVARKDKQFAKADELRDKVHALGYDIVDTPSGQQIQQK